MATEKKDTERKVTLTLRVSVPAIGVALAQEIESLVGEIVADLENVRFDATRSIPRPER